MMNSKIHIALFGVFMFFIQPMVAADHSPVADTVQFICNELLGRPTDKSIALNICVDKDIEAYVEYGIQKGSYAFQTPVNALNISKPFTIQLNDLAGDTKYFYRVRYRVVGTTEFLARQEHSFHTARPKGKEFVFAIEADPHLDTSTSPILYKRTLVNILNSNPDFLIDLGDTFMSEKLPVINQNIVEQRNLLLRSFFDTVAHSVPLMLVQGNHDGELGWLLKATADNLAVWAANIRKSYYPNPIPGDFYTGDTSNVLFVGQRQNYYAWEWGSALFIVLDPYWYTLKKPGATKNNWDWSIGKTQYDWLAKTLQSSKADYKFVFAHQVVGGSDTEGRGGIEAVPYYEMGGLNGDGTPGFAINRPGWPMPIHQLMVQNHVSAYFHGHDHVFVKQDLDGVVYHEVPQPAYYIFTNPEKSYSNIALAAQYGYTHGNILPSSGYLRVTVRDTGATVDYIRSYMPEHENALQKNGATAFSYTIKKFVTGVPQFHADAAPYQFSLSQNYPNPFNPVTTIQYSVPGTLPVTLKVMNMLGQEMARLVDEVQEPGKYSVTWNGSTAASGLYFCTVSAGAYQSTKKMILIK